MCVCLCVRSKHARAKAVIGITDLCTHLKVPVPRLDYVLPPSLFSESENLLHQLHQVSRYLAKFQYVHAGGAITTLIPPFFYCGIHSLMLGRHHILRYLSW